MLKEIIVENFPGLGTDLDIQVHKAKRTPYYLSVKRFSPRHIAMKLSKISDRASLVAQWLGTRLPMQGTWVRALVREDPTCHRATKPVCYNY